MNSPHPDIPTLLEPEPWPDEVDGEALLDELTSILQRFVIFAQPYAPATVALWIAHTHVLDAADHSPILAIVSPDKRCGKTTLLDLITDLAYKAAPIVHITPANLFRSIDDGYRTLVLDEADTYLKSSPDLIGLINRGHTKAGAYTMRRQKTETGYEAQWFSLWSAKAIASIGRLWHTLADRSIRIAMRRAGKLESHERVRPTDRELFKVLQQKLRRWAKDHGAALREIDPQVPDELNSREADNWRILTAIAEVSGSRWLAVAQAACLSLRAKESELTTPGVQLLADIRTILAQEQRDFIPTESLLLSLFIHDDAWKRFDHGKALNAKGLSQLLADFEITSERRRIPEKENKPFRGYFAADFKTAFDHYLPPPEPEESQAESSPVDSHDDPIVPDEPGVPGNGDTTDDAAGPST